MGRQNQSRVPFFGSKNILTGTHNDHRVLQSVWMYRALTDRCLYKPNSSKFLSKRMFSFSFLLDKVLSQRSAISMLLVILIAPWKFPSILSMGRVIRSRKPDRARFLDVSETDTSKIPSGVIEGPVFERLSWKWTGAVSWYYPCKNVRHLQAGRVESEDKWSLGTCTGEREDRDRVYVIHCRFILL